MFYKDLCKRCGACLIACPALQMTKDQARREILRLVDQGVNDFMLDVCAGCGYCDSICPTKSNPSDLRKEILHAQNARTGVSGLRIMSDTIPFCIMTAGLQTDKAKKLARLSELTSSPAAEEVFYLGCSLSYIYTDLAESSLFHRMPSIGGMKYCCGAYVYHSFGLREAEIHGRALLDKLRRLGVKKMVAFCPECQYMLGCVYPSIIDGFDISIRSIHDYLLEEYEKGRLVFDHPIPPKVTFHDACAWRKLDAEVYETPRKLLRAMGAEYVEMKHNRRKSICCGTPLIGKNSPLAARIAGKRAQEALDTGAQVLVVGCTGCFSLSTPAAMQGMETYAITELVQMAIGEKPFHRIDEIKAQLITNVMSRMSSDPALYSQKYVVKDGVVVSVS